MTKRLLLLALVVCLWLSLPLSEASCPRFGRPLELVVLRNTSNAADETCSLISFRHVQIHRGIPCEPTGYILDSHRVTTTADASGLQTERVRIFAYDAETAVSQARTICGGSLAMEYQDLPTNAAPTSTARPQAVLSNPSTTLILPTDYGPTSSYPPLDIRPLIVSGPSDNRVDLVFFSDGYLAEDLEAFLKDAKRLAQDISKNQTFNSVRPLMNFWAAFSPSNERGVGVGGKPNDTPFGLYRDGTELRAVYTSKPDAGRAACLSLGDKCDYPILLGNDPLYGGLGGEFTIITASYANGPLVLRHELGHSVINVGEEYDGGFAYFGVNAAHSPDSNSWAHWLNTSATIRVERAVMPHQAYPWTLLNTTAPWKTSFNASGMYSWSIVRFSLSGIPSENDLRVELDGVNLQWKPKADIGVDRWHYDIPVQGGLSDGLHEVSFSLLNRDREPQAQLCSVEIMEFGNESEFVAAPGYYSRFPTLSDKNETSYRPTNEDCLMRIVTSSAFCKVCLEGLWLSLFSRVDPIDDVQSGCYRQTSSNDGSKALARKWMRRIDLALVPLAQFRTDNVNAQESYEVIWRKDGQILHAHTNRTSVDLDDEDGVGIFDIEVKFTTPEVRVDEKGFLTSRASVAVEGTCAGAQEV